MKATTANIEAILNVINSAKARSAWSKGVKTYANMLIENIIEYSHFCIKNGKELPEITESLMLNGASDWGAYSWGGSALIYNEDIAETLCSPSELKRCKGGERRPNNSEEWLDVQARALWQAARSIKQAMNLI